MSDLTLDEKADFAATQARQLAAEKHFFEAAQPFYPSGFSIFKRNPGHWDISAQQCPGKASAFLAANPGSFTTARDGQEERAFRIRGEPGRVVVYDERWDPNRPHPRADVSFRSIIGAILWIAEELTQESGE